jgi:hypothetical protein
MRNNNHFAYLGVYTKGATQNSPEDSHQSREEKGLVFFSCRPADILPNNYLLLCRETNSADYKLSKWFLKQRWLTKCVSIF